MSLLLRLSNLKRSPRMAGIRKYTNLLYYDPGFVNIDTKNFDVIEVDGCRFKVTDQVNAIQRVNGNDWFDRVKRTDVVVDIGANIGAMTIPFAKAAKKVYAVEPLFYDDLGDNIELNGLHNVDIIPMGVGKLGRQTIEFSSKSAVVSIVSFAYLRELVKEPIDFLKMDGEGCEWDIRPEELKGIRELRIEFHIQRDNVHECRQKYDEYMSWMKTEGYEVKATDEDAGPNPYFIGHPEVRASMR